MSPGPRAGGPLASALPAALLALLLAGCATPQRPTGDEVLSGRLSIRIDGPAVRSVTADFDLSGSAREGELLLSGPLGTTAARARWSPGHAVLITGDGQSSHPSLDALAEQALGQVVPIGALFDWLRGRPWPAAPASPRSDGGVGFEQLGWLVGLAQLAEGSIEARRSTPPVVTLRVRLTRPD